MSTAAGADAVPPEATACWCRGTSYPELFLLHLNSRPDAVACLRCGETWLTADSAIELEMTSPARIALAVVGPVLLSVSPTANWDDLQIPSGMCRNADGSRQ